MKAIKNGIIVKENEILNNKILVIKDDTIVDIVDSINEENFDRIIDAHGRYVMPGMIDIHADKIEQFIQPRATAIMDFEFSLKECERELLLQGITTMYHSLSLLADDLFGSAEVRKKENVLKLSKLINDIHEKQHLIHHRLHLRLELDNLDGYDILKESIEKDAVHLISFMDHSPGQGQYKNIELYKKILESYKSKDVQELGAEKIVEAQMNKKMLSLEQLKEISKLAHEKNIAIASHDDDTIEKLAINEELQVDISEFPITIEVAKEAKKKGFATLAGAPNILLGGSHSGNLSAEQAILEDSIDILCSDYYPAALLSSVFIMHQKHNIPLYEMMNKVTLNPAKAVKIDKEYGSIEKGKKADLIIVELLDNYPVVTHTLVDGVQVSRIEYRK